MDLNDLKAVVGEENYKKLTAGVSQGIVYRDKDGKTVFTASRKCLLTSGTECMKMNAGTGSSISSLSMKCCTLMMDAVFSSLLLNNMVFMELG